MIHIIPIKDNFTLAPGTYGNLVINMDSKSKKLIAICYRSVFVLDDVLMDINYQQKQAQ